MRHRRACNGLGNYSKPHRFYLALLVNKDLIMTTNNHLASISTRNQNTRLRDAFFAACVALAAAFAVTTVSAAADAATPSHVSHR